jgi:CelD/BcsL family acetyltransferase involved in cellulose biosynthesis
VVQVIVVTLSIVKIILSGRTAFTRILNRVKTKKRRKNIKEFCRRIDEVLFGIQVVIRE